MQEYLMKIPFSVLHLRSVHTWKFQSLFTFATTLQRQILFIWIQWQTLTMQQHVCQCARCFSTCRYIFCIFQCDVLILHCTFYTTAMKFNHWRHLHLNTIMPRWQYRVFFFMLLLGFNFWSGLLFNIEYLHVSYSSKLSILLPLVTSVLLSNAISWISFPCIRHRET